jgi:MtN3 and saliva related transmembrane protein
MHLPLISKAAGFIANISSNMAFLPQIFKSYQRKRVEDVSIGMFFILFLTQVCWILYAVPIGAQNLWASSLIEIALLLPVFFMWFKYKPRKHSNSNNNRSNQPLTKSRSTITGRHNLTS